MATFGRLRMSLQAQNARFVIFRLLSNHLFVIMFGNKLEFMYCCNCMCDCYLFVELAQVKYER